VQRREGGGLQRVQYEFAGLHKDGTEVMVGVHGSVALLDGKPVIMGVLQDITDKLRVEAERRDYVAHIERMITGAVNAMSTMVELRDPYTAGHERRVGELSAAIAAEMGCDELFQRGLRIAGAVHDVGKIAVPAEILTKPGKLTPLEYQMVKEHAQQGYEVLRGIDSLWPIAEVARQHHERIDGSGYPRGLKGDEILLEARILAVADVVESMGSHRPYRPTLGIDIALLEIERNAGKLYDAQAAAACLRLFRDQGYTLPA
jgi:HD-GYP domain-containing protein (c-di-GMP phosphodiesterase class II)